MKTDHSKFKGDILELKDDAFEQLFESASFPSEEFNHKNHLRLAWIHLQKYGLDQAIKNVVIQLKDYVNKLGAQDKFHMTLTVAAVHIMNHFKDKASYKDFDICLDEHPILLNDFKKLLLAHYSPNILASNSAKQVYIKPDKLPFE